MSNEVRDDKKALAKRTNKLEGVEAPLRDRIVKDLFKKLEDKNIGHYVRDQWSKGNAHRSKWLERQKAYLSEWDEHLVSSTEGPFAGSSQLHIPITFIVCKTLHGRYLQAVWSDPPFNIRARKASYVDRVPVVRDVMQYALTRWANHNKGVGKVVDMWLWKWVTSGSAVIKQHWDVSYTRFKDVRTVKKPGPPRIVVQNGQEIPQPGPLVESEEEFDNVRKCFDGPVMKTVGHEDLLIIGGSGDPDVADEVHERVYLTASEVWTLVDRGIFNEDASREMIEGGRQRRGHNVGEEIKEQRAINAGQGSAESEAEHDRYEVLESYLKVDTDGSGIVSDVIVWTHAKSGRLLRATYLYRANKAGKRPYKKADFHLREGQEYGIGIPELIYPLQKEIDAIHNMRLDFGLISVMPFGFYRSTSSLDPKKIQLEPGALIPVDDPQRDVFFPNLGNRSVFGFQEEQAIDTLIQRLTGVNDLALGMMGSQGATRTATGSRVLANEMSTNLDTQLRRLSWAWEAALKDLLDMLQQRLPKGLSFRISGEDGQEMFRSDLSVEDIEGDLDVEITSNSATSNPMIQQNTADEMMQMVSNPLAIQLGVITPAQFYEGMRNWFISRQVRDWGKYIQKPQGYQYTMPPVNEVDAVASGHDVQISPNADHQGFIDFWEYFKTHDELLGHFTQDQTMRVEAQARKHAEMLQALKASAAQSANVSQMQRNASMSQQQTAPAGVA